MPEPTLSSSDKEQFQVVQPSTVADWDSYFDLRWRVLREPWNQPRGSERDPSDVSAHHLMIKDDQGKAAAAGRLHLNSPEEAQVRYMAVDPEWRGRGAGGQILRGLEDFARQQGAKAVILNAREEAIAFYERHGYRVSGPADTLFGQVRHVRMAKELERG
jgi:predicted GNAT family N-acyltransferase